MCLDPITLAAISAGITATTAVVSHNAQSDAAEQQGKALQQQRDAENMDNERAATQERERAAAEANAYASQANKEMAAFDAMTGEYGGNGRGMSTLGIQQGQDLATIQSNSLKGQAEIGFSDMASANKRTQGMAAINKPSILQTGLTIAGAGVNAASTYQKTKALTGVKQTQG